MLEGSPGAPQTGCDRYPTDRSSRRFTENSPVGSGALLQSEDVHGNEQVRLPDNGLLACLVHVAKLHGLSANALEIAHGLPATSTGLTIDYLEEAAGRLGLVTRSEQRRLIAIPAVTFPVLLTLKDGSFVVLKERTSSDKLVIFMPSPLETTRTLSSKQLNQDYTGLCVFLTPEFGTASYDPTNDAFEAKPSRWFWSAVSIFWPNYLQVALCGLFVNLLGLAAPLFTMNVYDRVVPNLAIPTLWTLTAGVALALVFDFFLRLLRTSIVDQTGRRVDMAISGRLFDHLLAIKLTTRPNSSGDLSNQIREFDTVRDLITSSTVIALMDTVFIGLFLYVIWLLVGPLAYVVGAAVPLVLVVTILCQLPLESAVRRSQQDSGRRHGLLFETLSGLETVKSIGAASWLRRKWDRNVALSASSAAQARFWNSIALSVLTSVQQVTTIAVTVWGVFLILDGEITMGAVIATNLLAGRVLAPLANVAQTLSRLSQARSAVRSLNAFMALPADRNGAGLALPAPIRAGSSLEIRDIGVQYPGQAMPALEKVSTRFQAGERVGIVGLVGAGKSTFGRALSGLVDPSTGQVLFNGIDCRQFGPATLRQAVRYCGQDPDIFSGTVRDNLLMSQPFADDDALLAAVRQSGLERHLAQHDKGLDMDVLERGRNLSGGQRQSIALARIFLSPPSFLFLDEPSAAMDKQAERELMGQLAEIARQGTALLIATHKEAALAHVDRILVFDRGRLALDGPRDLVLQKLASFQKPVHQVKADAKSS
ncbi:ATP-binding cassette, subfamily C, LapB [Roseibium denhamense]|uniref:ATP-binding cassette, subfamily C, LapB n=1 Tax=Roseibium denhamense TaxID=76305 RepID=A0ABY1NFX5_9HYPH|nr:ATP-binding cassette, subfamily C, LapB [Roseibium denhamense]